MSTTRKMVVAEAVETKARGLELVVEVNEVDEDGTLVQQHARSPFTFPHGTPEATWRAEVAAAMAPYLAPPVRRSAPASTHRNDLIGREL